MLTPPLAHPALTFVVPAYNAAGTVGDTIDSLLVQTRGDWAAVVVDDGSTDGTVVAVRLAADGDPRITVLSQANAGLAAARNRGLAACRSDPVCFLDADDTVDADFACEMLAALGEHDIVACAYRMVGPGLEDLGWDVHPSPQDRSIDRLIEFNPFAVGGVVVRRSAAARLGSRGPMFDPALTVHEDWDCWLRLTTGGARWSPVVDRPLFSYRMTPGSMSGNLDRMWRVGLDVIRRADAPAGLKPRAERRWTIRHIARATARGDGDLARRLVAELRGSTAGALTEAEQEFLAGSVRWAFCRELGVAPHAAADHLERWRGRAAGTLAGLHGLDGALRGLSTSGSSWTAAARALADRLGASDRLVIYGLGRNGRALLAALDRVAPSLVQGWIDDHPRAAPPPPPPDRPVLPRFSLDDLTPAHVVMVTPDDRAAILARLAAAGITRALTADDLLNRAPTVDHGASV
ncbi:MAG: glycosyltransferase family 2 protein [Phycisphaerales bacterium]